MSPCLIAARMSFVIWTLSIFFSSSHQGSLWDQPIVKPEPRNVLVIGCIVHDQREILGQCDRCDHQVGRSDLYSLLHEGATHFPELFGAGRVKIENGHFLEQVADEPK